MAEAVLIIGYGRAGKRHAKMAAGLGLDVQVYDPYLPIGGIERDGFTRALSLGWPLESEQDFIDDLRRVTQGWCGYAVICTPPKEHLWQLRICLEAGFKVLCEKPLCGNGQLDEAKQLPTDAPVMVAYNYRYHPKLVKVKGKFNRYPVRMVCSQYRPELPEWGLLLDHCSHDLDIMRMLTGLPLKVTRAKYGEYRYHYAVDSKDTTEDVKDWTISLQGTSLTSSSLLLHSFYEAVSTNKHKEREATIKYGWGDDLITAIDIDPDPRMFTDMCAAFLNGDYYPDLTEAIKTQELLEQCYSLEG